ncbi:MAG: type II toxin-antitoxin system RelE/ParE family toxin [Synergistaceae bacterium]|nr:type II toxin-antitoxin system RelE/ParE family toxin [Synergistaceae bacterium]
MPLLYSIEYTSSARKDLRAIKDYISDNFHSYETAAQQIQRITMAVRALSIFPKRYRVRKKVSSGEEVRFLPVDNYTVLYTVDDATTSLTVLRVVYGRRNIYEII